MYDLLLNEEQSLIVDSIRDFLSGEYPVERLRPNAAVINELQIRSEITGLGWVGIGLPESAGGSCMGLAEEALVQRECGRFLVGPWALAHTLAAHVAVDAADDVLAQKIVRLEQGITLALPIAGTGDRILQNSVDVYLFDHQQGNMLLCWTEQGMGLFSDAAITDLKSDECIDNSITLQRGRLAVQDPEHWVERNRAPLLLRAKVLLAAALTGLAENACDITVEYAKTREQFGKPIGAFQAVKHRCADMGLRSRLAWYQTSLASLKVDGAEDDADAHVMAAVISSAQAAHENAQAAIQLHGGIGFQAECDVHWFMKRAHVYELLCGSLQLNARQLARVSLPAA